ncbi:MAG: hypothetical protein AAB434_10510 [Planctomycetota bacterium]
MAVSLLVALLLAAPILYIRLGESRQRLDQALHRARSVREFEAARVADVRADLDRCVGERALDQDEVLAHVEAGVQRMLPRPIVQVRLPEALPLPEDLTPAVAPYVPPAEPVPALAAEPETPRDEAAPALDAATEEVVGAWTEELARSLGLNAMQKQRCSEVFASYLTRLKARLAAARKGQPRNAVADSRRLRAEAIATIEGVLTAEQSKLYDGMKDRDEDDPNSGMILRPLPGTHVPRSQGR